MTDVGRYKVRYQIGSANDRMGAVDITSETIYDRVVGKPADKDYEKISRRRVVGMIDRHAERTARKLIWC